MLVGIALETVYRQEAHFNGTATATFTAADQGQQDANGNLLYKGIVFYRAEPTGKLGFLDNKIGLYVYWQNTSGNDWSKVWEWK